MGCHYEAMSDEELALAYYACDDRALDQLMRRHDGALGRMVLHALPRQLDRRPRAEWAREVVQVTWIKVIETKGKPLAQWDPGRPFGPWLRTVAYRCTFDAIREWERRDKPLAPLTREDMPAPSPRLEPGSESHLALLDLQRCIEELPPMDLWMLAASMEIDQRVIAQRLEKSEAFVTRALAGIRARLRKCLSNPRNGGD